jgi:hypothetical protein
MVGQVDAASQILGGPPLDDRTSIRVALLGTAVLITSGAISSPSAPTKQAPPPRNGHN